MTVYSETELDGVRVLLVDDDDDSRRMLAVLLGQSGAVVSVAGTAAEALGVFQRCPPDVLLSDIGLPNEDGYSLLRKVRLLDALHGGNVVAVAVSGYERDASRGSFDAHFTKPVAVSALVATLRSLLGTTPSTGADAPHCGGSA